MIGLDRAIGVVALAALLADPARFGVQSRVQLGGAVRAARRGPVYWDAAAVLPELRPSLGRFFATRATDYPPAVLIGLDRAALVGEGSLLVGDASRALLLQESAAEFLNTGRAPVGLVPDQPGGFRLTPALARRHVTTPCLLLKRPWANNFGHWLVDQAMALAWLAARGLVPTPHLVVHQVASAGLRQVMRDMVAAILPGAVLHEHPHDSLWTFESLHYVQPVHVPPLSKRPEAVGALRAAMLAELPPSPLAAPRLYLARTGTLRRLDNEAEIADRAARAGFVAVQPERYPIAQQVALFAHAEAVLGVKGAALTTLLFAPPSCRVMLLSPGSFIDPFFWDIASLAGMAYAETFGPVTTDRAALGRNDFRLDPRRLDMMLGAAFAAPAQSEAWRCVDRLS